MKNATTIEDRRFERTSYIFEAEKIAYDQLMQEGVRDRLIAEHDDGSTEALDEINYLFSQEVSKRAHELYIDFTVNSYTEEELAFIKVIKSLYDDFLKDKLVEEGLIVKAFTYTEMDKFLELLADDYDEDGLIESLNLSQDVFDRLGI